MTSLVEPAMQAMVRPSTRLGRTFLGPIVAVARERAPFAVLTLTSSRPR